MSRKVQRRDRPFRFTSLHILGFLLIIWVFISNPQAAWLGRDRNWIFTFFQLWVLLWLSGELLDSPRKHHALFWIYSLVTAVSAAVAIQQGSLGEGIDLDLRVSGLAGGANTAARYFVVAVIFFNHLRSNTTGRLFRILALIGMVTTFVGLFVTVSRTGILLLFAALGLLVIFQPSFRYRAQTAILFVIAWLLLWYWSDTILSLLRSIIPSIAHGADTVGLRYALWDAGWRMWQEYPIAGVGVGRYSVELRYFAQDLPQRFWSAVSHNMYIQMLAETGAVGFALFMLLLGRSLKNLWHGLDSTSHEWKPLQRVWLIVFLVMLLGGITKTDQVDKMIWMTMGVSVCLSRQYAARAQKEIVGETVNAMGMSHADALK
jgi:O-antigen ligase